MVFIQFGNGEPAQVRCPSVYSSKQIRRIKSERSKQGRSPPTVHFDPDTRVLWWHHYDKRDHIAAFRGTHTFPHPKSRLQVRSKTGTLTSAMHRFVRASTSAGRFVNKTVKQAKAMLDKGHTWQQVKHRVIMFSKFDESLGSKWIRVRGMILRKLRRQANR